MSTEATAQTTVSIDRRIVVGVGIVIVIAAAAIAYFVHTQQIRTSQRAALQRQIEHYQNVQHQLADIQTRINDDGNDFDKQRRIAQTAGTKRHDIVVAGNASTAETLPLAVEEQMAVKQLQAGAAAFDQEDQDYLSVTDEALGSDATHQLRLDIQSATSSLTMAMVAWTEAITDIVDNDKMALHDQTNSTSSDEIGRIYQKSADDETRASSALSIVRADKKHINDTLAAKIRDLQATLTNT